MNRDNTTPFWGAMACSQVWAASENSTALAVAWFAFAILIAVVDLIARPTS